MESLRPELPAHWIYHGYCFCGLCNTERFHQTPEGRMEWGFCPPDLEGCKDSVGIDREKIVWWGNGYPASNLYCISSAPEPLDNVAAGICDNAGYVSPCWDYPLCSRPDWCPWAGDPEAEAILSEYLPPDPPLCTEDTHAHPNVVLAARSREEVADALLPKCMVHGEGFPDLAAGVQRFCFAACFLHDEDYYVDEAIDPPSTTSRSTIFEVRPDGDSYAGFDGPAGVFTAHVSGRFAVEFSPYCAEGISCRAALSLLEVDTTAFNEGPWTLGFEDEDYEVYDFSVVNKKWSRGTMSPSSAGYSSILFPPTEEGLIDLYVSGPTDHGLRGINYTEQEGRSLHYRWSDGSAYLLVSYEDERGEFMVSLVGHSVETPPVADAGSDLDLSCDEELMHLDASGSTDSQNDISTYTWYFIDGGGELRSRAGKTADVPVEFEMGTTSLVSLEVVDARGLSDTDELYVSVGKDDRPPEVEGIDLPASCLWHPEEGANHQKVKFKLGRDILPRYHEVCGSEPVEVRIVGASSSQPEDEWLGDGETTDDVVFNESTVCMRAERNIFGFEDRIYTVVLEFSDQAGNSVQSSVHVRVPYSMTEEAKAECGDMSRLDFVLEDDQECAGSEGQYPSAPPPPGCLSSIAGVDSGGPCPPLLCSVLALAALFLSRRKRGYRR